MGSVDALILKVHEKKESRYSMNMPLSKIHSSSKLADLSSLPKVNGELSLMGDNKPLEFDVHVVMCCYHSLCWTSVSLLCFIFVIEHNT